MLRPKVSDKALLKTLPLPEEIDNEGPSALVEDSDNEEEPYQPVSQVRVPEVVTAPEVSEVVTPVIAQEVVSDVQEVVAATEKPKKKAVVKKKVVAEA